MGKYSLTQLRGMLEEAVSESDPKPFKMAKWAYQACMDTEELEVSLFLQSILILFSAHWSGTHKIGAGKTWRMASYSGG